MKPKPQRRLVGSRPEKTHHSGAAYPADGEQGAILECVPLAAMVRTPLAGNGTLSRTILGLPRHTALTEHHSGGWPSPWNLRSSTTLAPLMRVCDETPGVSQSTVNRAQLAKRSAPLDGSAPGSTDMLACAGRRTTRVRHLVSPCAGQIALTGPDDFLCALSKPSPRHSPGERALSQSFQTVLGHLVQLWHATKRNCGVIKQIPVPLPAKFKPILGRRSLPAPHPVVQFVASIDPNATADRPYPSGASR
jgi:hypothetical protein